MTTTFVMPMAGKGSRFRNNGISIPKPIIDINGVPMFVHAEKSVGIQFDKYVFITQQEDDLSSIIYQYYPDATIVEIDGITEGAACTIMKAQEHFEGGIFICNCDQIIEYTLTTDMLTNDGVIAVFEDTSMDPKWSFAKIVDNIIVRVAEKDPISTWATAGWYYWKDHQVFVDSVNQMIANNDRVNNEFYICPVFNYTIESGHTITPFIVDRMHGVGTPEDLDLYLGLINDI